MLFLPQSEAAALTGLPLLTKAALWDGLCQVGYLIIEFKCPLSLWGSGGVAFLIVFPVDCWMLVGGCTL